MNYKEQWGSPHPGHIIFLIDLSNSMNDWADNEKTITRFDLAKKCLERSIRDISLGCYDAETDNVLNRAYITVIGYGRQYDNVEILREGWATTWHSDSVANKKGVPFPGLEISGEGWTPMAGAFQMAKECLVSFRESIEEQIDNPDPNRPKNLIGIGNPVVLNITDGRTSDFEQVDGYEELVKKSATELINTYSDDGGNIYLLNAHIGSGKEILLPSDRQEIAGIPEAEFLFDISSSLSANLAKSAASVFPRPDGAKPISEGCKGFVANSKTNTFTKFINWGSQK